MPDVLLCRNEDCQQRATCYRYRAIPSNHQSYGEFYPMGDGTCADYWDCREYVESRLVPMNKLDSKWFWPGD